MCRICVSDPPASRPVVQWNKCLVLLQDKQCFRTAGKSTLGKHIVATVRFWGYAVAQLVGALRYKPEGRGFDGVIRVFH